MSSDETYSRLQKNKRKARPFLHIFLWIVFFVFLLFLMGVGLFTYYAASAPHVSYHTLSSDNSTTIYDRNGQVISRLGMQNRDYVKHQDIPENLKNAIISVEDRHFYQDKGVDPIRIVEAGVSNIFGRSGGLQGGSTLTQQLIKLSVFSTKASDQTLKRKAQEAWLAVKVDKDYSKQQILEFYINKVYMGNNSYGMQTISQTLYHKPLNQLDLAQTALLAGLPQAPVAYNPVTNPKYATIRRNQVLDAMVKNKAISQKQANQAKRQNVQNGIDKANVNKTPTQKDEKYADAYISQVTQEMRAKGFNLNAGNKIYTNLDMNTQKHMYQLANDDNAGLAFNNNDFQIGATMVNPQNGKVVSMLGSRKQNVLFGLNRAVQTDHSSGSTMKPLMDYGPAIEYLKYPTYQSMKDTPFTYPGTDKQLNDFDNKHQGTITMRQALVQSRNIPAIRTLQDVGIPRATEFLKGLGMTFKEPLNLQNGIGAYISSEQEAAAYAAFANGGTYHEPYLINKIVTPTGESKQFKAKSHRAMSPATAFMITDMLKGVMTDPQGSGTAANIAGLYQAGKTGTTQYPDNYLNQVPKNASMDSWFTGYTKNLSLSIWTGFDRPLEPDHYLSEPQTKIAQQFYKQVMERASENQPNENWTKPDDVVKTKKNGQTQYYIVGHGADQTQRVNTTASQSQQAADNQSVVPNQADNKQQDQTTNEPTNGMATPTEQTPTPINNDQPQNTPTPSENQPSQPTQNNNQQPQTNQQPDQQNQPSQPAQPQTDSNQQQQQQPNQ
ncbi:Multimodular transpeptidase-transglycosylase [Fructilactobacillus florum 8D]|uniref:Multimodular transpeptidase-transglycosylase n=1 Tax=Fructilactobacillus florum 8D TaxID=1221538 RepID=W9ELT4_9LACO|nr:transglycosylase domain-containing protein [Fructilactobacillus florum]ETO40644.1 Multimodular transpeptidase-transglycosylase [Fructilactobacillus florum 8D]